VRGGSERTDAEGLLVASCIEAALEHTLDDRLVSRVNERRLLGRAARLESNVAIDELVCIT